MDWIFQGNPDIFDLDGYLASMDKVTWSVRQKHLASDMKSGDRVFFWRAKGSTDLAPGVVAIGEIVSSPDVMLEHPEAIPYWKEKQDNDKQLRVWVRIIRRSLTKWPLVGRDELLRDPILSRMHIFKIRNLTNYQITMDDGLRLFEFCSQGEGSAVNSHSWTIEGPSAAYKVLDKSAFLNRGTGIPFEIRPFFIDGEMKRGKNRHLVLVHDGAEYDAHIDMEGHETARTRLFWYKEFTQLLRNTFPHHHKLYSNNKNAEPGIVLRFERLSGFDKYLVSFLNTNEITNKIEGTVEAEEQNKPVALKDIAKRLNLKSKSFEIGSLQEVRLKLGLTSKKSKHTIFNINNVHETWAHHYGGRSELQFNIGLETRFGSQELRYGVAFSFETSRSFTSIDDLVPKVSRLNEFIRINEGFFSDMKMWHHYKNVRSQDYAPSVITSDLVTKNVFLFVGKRQAIGSLDYNEILNVFDRLMPLYKYVEGTESFPVFSKATDKGFKFAPGCSIKNSLTSATTAQKTLDVSLRHNDIQARLYGELSLQYGKENVGTERPNGIGSRVDAVVKNNDQYSFYEIKTGISARACIRDAIGQLLEYSFWPGSQKASKLVIVGTPELDAEGRAYLQLLRDNFGLPIFYRQVVI